MSYTVFPQVFFIVAFSLGFAFLLNKAKLNGKEKNFSNTCGIIFVIYISILLFLTTVDRGSLFVRSLTFVPFSSYKRVLIEYNTFEVLSQIFQNILVFIPAGMLIPYALYIKNKKHSGISTVLLGLFLSFFIELTQYTYAIGYSEIDDLINNSLGCFIGYGIFCFIDKMTVDRNGIFIKKEAFKGFLPMLITISIMFLIVIYREFILYYR